MLPAFAAKCLQQCTHNQHLQQTPALSSKPTSCCCCWTMGQTDGWTERQTPDRYTDPAPHTMRAVSTTEQQSTNQKQQSLWCYFSCHSDTIIQLPQGWLHSVTWLCTASCAACDAVSPHVVSSTAALCTQHAPDISVTEMKSHQSVFLAA